MRTTYSLSALDWRVSGWTPELWRLLRTMEVGVTPDAEVAPIPAPVPGSVQQALRRADLLPDWNAGLESRACEWVENRHWIYEVPLPDEWLQPGRVHRLRCLGLDYRGSVWLNGVEVGAFQGTHVPHVFDLTPHLQEQGNRLRIVFDLPPRWLGQFNWTSRVREWKTRFNYTWDWQARLVQVGIWDDVLLEVADGQEFRRCRILADAEDGLGVLRIDGEVQAGEDARVRVTLAREGALVREETLPAAAWNAGGVEWRGLPVELWWPNGEGAQPLYQVACVLLDADRAELDRVERRVGFRHIVWESCEGAMPEADPWICVVNGRPIFLQGVNYPPMLPNFADTTQEDYRARLALYRELGANTFRVNGVGHLEKECFYDLCDEMGILVWQDVPLSSSGIDNTPPDDPEAISQVAKILESFIERRQHHACLLLWCGGNELHHVDAEGRLVPWGLEHPMLARLREVAAERDPGRRYIPTTPTGPRVHVSAAELGTGVHWNVHGPWKPPGGLDEWEDYWRQDDSLFRAESGAPGACSAEIIRRYAGAIDPLPVSAENPLWRRHGTWWIESAQFAAEHGRPPETLEEYVDWSQARQAKALALAVGACKDRFPRCGGILLWCGHDCFPCAANTSIIDFHNNPKPAALALSRIWRRHER